MHSLSRCPLGDGSICPRPDSACPRALIRYPSGPVQDGSGQQIRVKLELSLAQCCGARMARLAMSIDLVYPRPTYCILRQLSVVLVLQAVWLICSNCRSNLRLRAVYMMKINISPLRHFCSLTIFFHSKLQITADINFLACCTEFAPAVEFKKCQ